MYSIAVKIDDLEKRRRSVGLLHVVIGFFLVVKTAGHYRQQDYADFLSVAPLLLIASISLFYGFFRRKLDISARFNRRLRILQMASFLVLAFAFFSRESNLDGTAVLVFALLCGILVFSEKRIFAVPCLQLKPEGVTVPGAWKEYLVEWDKLSEVVIREDFITLFHVKQKYLQFQVMQDLSGPEIAKMTSFCREQIEAALKPAGNDPQ